jgi:hypothetical protein
MMSDEDTASLLLSPSVAAHRPNNYSNDRARSPSLLGLVMGQSAAIMKIFLMTQDSIDLERPTKAKFAIMWDAMKKMHEPLVIKGSAEADNQLVEIIRKKQRAKQLPHASDSFCQCARIAQWHWHGQFVGTEYKQTCCENSRRNANQLSCQTRRNVPTQIHPL